MTLRWQVLWDAEDGAGSGGGGTAAADGQGDGQGAGNAAATGGSGGRGASGGITQAQYDELMAENATLRQEKAAAEQRAKGASEAQILQSRLDEVEPLAKAAEANEKALKSMVDAQVAQLPEALQGIVQKLPGGVAEQAAWLADSLPLLQQHVMPNTSGAASTSGRSGIQISDADRDAIARAEAAGLKFDDPADYQRHQQRAKERAGLD